MTFAQIGMANAIDQEDVKKEVQHMVDTFALRRTFIMEQLDQCKNLFYIKPHGAFYIMVDVLLIFDQYVFGLKQYNPFAIQSLHTLLKTH